MELEQVWVPTACTLPTVEQPLRVAEFDALFAERLLSVRRVGPTEAVLLLRDGPGVADQARGLAERESSCCSFFAFDVGPKDGGIAMRVTVPSAHAAVLAALAERAAAVADLSGSEASS